jgi:hypothetical protein
MKLGSFAAGGIAALALTAGSASAAVVISDPSFESPTLSAGGYEYGVQNGAQHSSDGTDAAATGMTFSNGAGVQSNGSAWGFQTAPDGTQTAFLQSYNNQIPGTITQGVTGLDAGDLYHLTLDIADRPGYAVDPVTVEYWAIIGSTPTLESTLGTFTPGSTSWTSVTGSFKADAPTGYFSYSVAQNAGDADIGLDKVTISPVPETATWMLMLLGFGGLGAMMRAARRDGAGALVRV